LFPSNAAFAKNVYHDTYERVRVDIDTDIIRILIAMSRLSSTLMSRLVLNLREQNSALSDLPTTVETEHRFQAALPGALQPRTPTGNFPLVCPNDSALKWS